MIFRQPVEWLYNATSFSITRITHFIGLSYIIRLLEDLGSNSRKTTHSTQTVLLTLNNFCLILVLWDKSSFWICIEETLKKTWILKWKRWQNYCLLLTMCTSITSENEPKELNGWANIWFRSALENVQS